MSLIKYYVRRFVRETLSIYQFLFALVQSYQVERIDIKKAKYKLKKRDVLCLVAPGASTDSLIEAEWDALNDSSDMVFINSAFKHIRFKGALVSFEPHEGQESFLKHLSLYAKFKPSVFLRSSGSPIKIKNTIKALSLLNKIASKVYINKEISAYDINGSNYLLNHGLAAAVSKSRLENRFIEMGASLLFWLNFAEALNYSRVILIGFDFNDRYSQTGIKNDKEDRLISIQAKNILEKDVLFDVADSLFFKSGRCKYYVFKGEGVLSKTLQEYYLNA